MIFASRFGFSQNVLPNSGVITMVTKYPFYLAKQRPFSLTAIQNKNTIIAPSMLVSPTFYCSNLAFFCRQEIKFEKITKIPFKFRLGSVQYVDYLEGKRGATFSR
jgi:hypothetical protein